jgi:hypothetical protein
LLLIIIKKEKHFIDQNAIIALEIEQKEIHYGRKQAIRKNPHVINVDLHQNIKNNLMFIMPMGILRIVGIQI